MRYLLGVDHGGSSVKATLLSEEGQTVATAVEEYRTYYPQDRWAEHNPDELYAAFCRVTKRLVAVCGVPADQIVGLAISAASQSGVYLDENDQVIRNSIYWADMRGMSYARVFEKTEMEYFLSATANQPSPSRTLIHIMWLRDHEPENYLRIRKIMFTKDYIRYRLTGDFVTDYIDAMGSHFMDVPKNCWSEKLCSYAGITPDILPKILNPTDEVGPITRKAAEETGLSQKTKVYVGTTDTVMETYANGAVREGDMVIKLATAGRIISVTRGPLRQRGFVNYKHVVPGLWYPGAATRYCATTYRWYRDVLGDYEVTQAAAKGIDAYRLLDHLAEQAPVGSAGVMFMPFLGGVNDAPGRCAAFLGVRADHNKSHLTRAVLEGVGYSMKAEFETIRKLKLKVEHPTLIGGGAKGKIWQQIMADMLNTELILTENSDSSLGTAMLAGVASGIFVSFEDSVEKSVHRAGLVSPNPESVEIYNQGFRFYQKFIMAMDPIYAEIDQEQTED
jgi:xylulokinase